MHEVKLSSVKLGPQSCMCSAHSEHRRRGSAPKTSTATKNGSGRHTCNALGRASKQIGFD